MTERDFSLDNLDLSTLSLHADVLGGPEVNGAAVDLAIAPALSVTTTFIRPEGGAELQDAELPPGTHIYSRYTQPVRDRVERVLAAVNKAKYAVTYGSGLSAVFAALIHFHPTRIAISRAYFGSLKVVELIKRIRNIPVIGIDDELAKGDLVWLETPVNPTGEAYNIKYYAERVHKAGGWLVVDATFAPPPLQYPFEQGADLVMHSTTKYFGGHSDLLGGVLLTNDKEVAKSLLHDRSVIGTVMGSLELWLLLRSLRTLEIRVRSQSSIATELVAWLNKAAGGKAHDGIPANVVHSVLHSSVQVAQGQNAWILEQMPGGHGATFAILLQTEKQAQALPHLLHLLHNATSLGGVESLIEWRFGTDGISDPRLLRVSIGLESLEDLKRDWRQALTKVAQLNKTAK